MRRNSFIMTLYFALCVAVILTVSASAYIDPSVVSGLATAIAGVAVACGAAFFVIWRRVKNKVSKTLGIDENAGKEIEADLEIRDEDEKKEEK